MNHRNPQLHKALKIYVKAAIRLLQKEAEDSGSYQPELPITSFIFRQKDLEVLPQYRKCFSAFKEDSVIFGQLDTMLGVGLSGSRSMPLGTLMLHLPQLLGVYDEIFEFNELYFEREYQEFEDACYSDEIKYEVVVPLQNPKFKEPIKLTDNLEICRIRSKDLRLPLGEEAEIVEEAYPFDRRHVWAVRTSYKLPKVVERDKRELEPPEELEQQKENDTKREAANELVEQVISALRIFCTATYGYSHIYPAANFHRSGLLLFPRHKPFPIRYLPEFPLSTGFDEAFTGQFRQFWQMFKAETVVIQRKFIAVAARRFNLAHERHHWEDKIIDLLIAAEAIFFCDQSEKAELSYRLSLRASFFLGTDKEIRKQIFNDFRTAYQLRSKIVHGSDAGKLIAKIVKAEEHGLEGFVSKIQSHVCRAIYKSVVIANQNNASKHLVNWDTLVFEN